jgi:hypothetical protein
MPGNSFCPHFSPSSPSETIFLKLDADTIFIYFVTRPDGAGPKSIGNPIDYAVPCFRDLTIFNNVGLGRFLRRYTAFHNNVPNYGIAA